MALINATYEAKEEIPPEYEPLYEERQGKWMLAKIEGLVTDADIHRLTTANTRLRTEITGLKGKVDGAGGKTLDDFTKLEEEVDVLKAEVEAGGKPDEEKITTLVEARIKTRLGPLERDLKTSQEALGIKTSEVDKLQNTLTSNAIDDAVRKAATSAKVGVIPAALDDVIKLSSSMFELVTEDDGTQKVITKDKVGVTPGIDPEGYFMEVAPSKPYWFGTSQGAGANGGKNNLGGIAGSNPWSADNWNMTQQGQFLKQHGADKADQYAKQAGTSVGGGKPTKAK